MRALTLVLLAACCVALAVSQGAPNIVYAYVPRQNNIVLRSEIARGSDSGLFFIVFDDMDLNKTYIQLADPAAPTRRPYPPVDLTAFGVTPGSDNVVLSPTYHSLAAVIGVFLPNSVTAVYGLYNASAGVVYRFPGDNILAVTFGNTAPSWASAYNLFTGDLADMSRYVYTLGGCSAGSPDSLTVTQFQLDLLYNNSHRTWQTTLPSPGCAAAVASSQGTLLPPMMAYEDQVWVMDTTGRVYNLGKANGEVLYNVSNPCNMATWTYHQGTAMRFVNVGIDTSTDTGFGLPLYALLLTGGLQPNGQIGVCRLSHRTYTVEWSTTYPSPAGTCTSAHSAGPNAFLLYTTSGTACPPTAPVTSTFTFIDPVAGEFLFTLNRSLADFDRFPTFIQTRIGSCKSPFVMQTDGVLEAWCTDVPPNAQGMQPLWTSSVSCAWFPVTSPKSGAIACRSAFGPTFALQLLSAVDGTLLWQTPANVNGRALVTNELVWYYQNQNTLVGAAFLPASGSPQGSSPASSPGVSSGTAAAVSILMLVIGSVIGAVVFAKVIQPRFVRRTYTEVSHAQSMQ